VEPVGEVGVLAGAVEGVGAVLVALFSLRRRRDRIRLAQLRATEPPDEPAYWLGQAEDDAPVEPGGGGKEREGEESAGPASR